MSFKFDGSLAIVTCFYRFDLEEKLRKAWSGSLPQRKPHEIAN